MKKIPKAVYQTPDQLFEVIATKEKEANALPAGARRQELLIELGKLRAYAAVKQWVSGGSNTGKSFS
ncbi:hypothetical protein EON80_19385 [bacterium]|nr:MAG: hypothetical protein EON80_19385 [bacterium]